MTGELRPFEAVRVSGEKGAHTRDHRRFAFVVRPVASEFAVE